VIVRLVLPWRRDLACIETVKMVTDYLEGALPPGRRARFEHHLGGCDGCAEYLREIELTIAVLGRVGPEDIRPEALEALVGVFRAVVAEEDAPPGG
jgi:anti-sigma factor RsiW